EFQLMPDHAAPVVIDVRDELVRPGWTSYRVPEATRQVRRLARLLATCRARGVPVLYMAFTASHRGEASWQPTMRNKAALPKEPPSYRMIQMLVLARGASPSVSRRAGADLGRSAVLLITRPIRAGSAAGPGRPARPA